MQLIIANIHPDVEVQWQLTVSRLNEWIKNYVFSFKWWFLLVLFILCLYAWWKLTDKSRLSEIILHAGLILIIILGLDEIGRQLSLWYYTYDLMPLFPPISAIDFSCLPVVYSLIYQYFKPWRSFTIATIVMSTVLCFVLEPIFMWSGIYHTLSWKNYYGFPIYIFIAIIIKGVVMKIYGISKNS